jgi:hypothetical protein
MSLKSYLEKRGIKPPVLTPYVPAPSRLESTGNEVVPVTLLFWLKLVAAVAAGTFFGGLALGLDQLEPARNRQAVCAVDGTDDAAARRSFEALFTG